MERAGKTICMGVRNHVCNICPPGILEFTCLYMECWGHAVVLHIQTKFVKFYLLYMPAFLINLPRNILFLALLHWQYLFLWLGALPHET